MASIIRIKRSSGTAQPSNLKLGELAVTYGTGNQGNFGDRLMIGTGAVDSNGNAASIDVVGGKYFTDMLDHVAGTLTASSAIITDASNKIDNLKVDDIDLNGSTVSITASNTALTLSPNGTAAVNVPAGYKDRSGFGTNSLATKEYVDQQVGASTATLSDGSTTSAVDLNDSNLEFVPTTTNAANTVNGDITTAVSDNQVLIGIRDTAVSAGSYGSATAVPVITVNRKGQITAASTANVSSTLTIGADNGSDDVVNLLDSSLDIVGGTGITTTVSDNQVSIAGDDATTTTKGIASFATADFSVSSGAVSIKTLGVSNAQLAGSIENAKLSNSSIGLGGDNGSTDTLSLGDSVTFAGDGIISTTVSNTDNQVDFAIQDASTSQKGAAQFNPNAFEVSSGVVGINAGGIADSHLAGTLDLTGKTVSVATPSANAHAATKAYVDGRQITVNGNTVNVDGTITLDTDDINEGSTNLYYTDARADSAARSAVAVITGSASGGGALAYDSATGQFTFNPASSTSSTDALSGTSGISYDSTAQQFTLDTTHDATFNSITTAGNATIGGNLVVQGTTTTINTETLTTTDPLMHLADSNTAADAVDIGFIAKYNDGSTKHTGFFRDATDGKYKNFDGVADADMGDDSNTVATSASGYNAADLVVGTIEGQYAGFDSDFDIALAGKNTDNLSEGSTNQYFTNARARGAFSAGEGIDISGAGVISAELASETNPGIATFDGTHFSVDVSGDVTAADITLAGGSGTAAATLGETFTIAGTSAQGISTSATGTTVTITAANAAADGSTKGVAAFNSSMFEAASGVISSKDITITGTNGVSLEKTLGETVTFASDTRSATLGTGLTAEVLSGSIQIRQAYASTTTRGAALFSDSDFKSTSNVIEIKEVDGGSF